MLAPTPMPTPTSTHTLGLDFAGPLRTCQDPPLDLIEGNRRSWDEMGLPGIGLGGEGGIRTHDTLARIPVFETGTFNRSVTSPVGRDFTSAEDQRAGSMALSPPIYGCNATGMSTPPSPR